MNEWILPQGEAAALMPGASYSLPGLFLYSKLIYQCLDQVQDKFGYAIPVRYPAGNAILAMADEVGGGVIVSTPLLRDYIRAKYPNIEVHASVIMTAFPEQRDEG